MYKIIGADQKEYGPITADQLRLWISEGRINANTSVQAEGSGVWKRVGELPELAAALPAESLATHPSSITMASAPVPATANLMAVWAMIIGIISFIPCCWGILGIVSIILGCLALARIKKNPQLTGSGYAIAGIVLGILSILLAVASYVFLMSFPQYLTNLQNSLGQ